MNEKELKRLAGVLAPLQVPRMPLAEPPPRDSRFGSPLKLSRVHWVRPEVVVEVTFLTWTEDNLLRQVSYQGQREDKPARQAVRSVRHLEDLFISKTPCVGEMNAFIRSALLPAMQAIGRAPYVSAFRATELSQQIGAAGFDIVAAESHSTKDKSRRPCIVARKSDLPRVFSSPAPQARQAPPRS